MNALSSNPFLPQSARHIGRTLPCFAPSLAHISVLTPDNDVLSSDTSVLTSDNAVLSSCISVLTFDNRVFPFDISVLTPDISVLPFDISVLTPDSRVLPSDIKFPASHSPVPMPYSTNRTSQTFPYIHNSTVSRPKFLILNSHKPIIHAKNNCHDTQTNY